MEIPSRGDRAAPRRTSLRCSSGLSFSGKTILITGAGLHSIRAEVIKGLLSGGANVIVTTSRSVSDGAKFYISLYKQFGARNSRLTLLPFNQGSKKEREALIEHIYSNASGFGTDLALMTPTIARLCEDGPVYADLNGGLQFLTDLKDTLASARQCLMNSSKMQKALSAERVRYEAMLRRRLSSESGDDAPPNLKKRANLDLGFPNLPSYQTVTAGLKDL